MKTLILIALILCAACSAMEAESGEAKKQITFMGMAEPPAGGLTLWYRQPAEDWLEALPLGNGRLAAMVFGGVQTEHIQLNEEGIWSGGPCDSNNPEALQYLPEVRRLLFEGKNTEAEVLAKKHLLGKLAGVRPYQSLGDLTLDFGQVDEVANYRRELDLDSGVARVTYSQGGATFTREAFISAPDNVLVLHVTCDKSDRINAVISISREQFASSKTSGQCFLLMTGQTDGETGVKFRVNVAVKSPGGNADTTDDKLIVKNADSLTLLLTAATDYRGGDAVDTARRMLVDVVGKSYDALLKAHLKEHRKLFRRVRLDLGGPEKSKLPTDERIMALAKGEEDPALAALYFQFGRYLLMASSRPGCLPANLQGKWVDQMKPPWNADYHTNINVQMNYWPAEVCNLAECAEPLIELTDSLREPGRKTAQVHYGCKGWVAHHLTDAWGFTAPADGVWGIWPMGGAWLCQHVWEHYAFSGDRKYLKDRAYPIMKESAQFLLDFLVEDNKGRLVTNPSHSPENSFRLPDGGTAVLCVGATMDFMVIHDLFTNCIQASEILNIDNEFREQLQATLSKLAPLQVGKNGQLQEWLIDYDESEPGHRHVSHLFGVYPGRQITERETPRFYKAARTSLERRVKSRKIDTGWSLAWSASLWARFGEGDLAHQNITKLLGRHSAANMFDLIFEGRQPFQIDANFGATAAIAEMLLQSHEDELNFLPALPKAWPSGSVSGLRARGNYEVDLAWKAGRLSTAKIRVKISGPVQVHCHGVVLRSKNNAVELKQIYDGVWEFAAEAGKEYTFIASSSPAN
ncbi:MAG: glycoside hydrolase family 95 protein [Armatimonadota bacterium]|nr:glycoside hydrolase family 95 protein [Armatimonadota bacterium]